MRLYGRLSLIRGALPAIAIVTLLTVAGVGVREAAAQGGSGNPFDAIVELLGSVDSRLTALEVSVAVDEQYCATGGVQCGGEGHSATVGANSGNHNPVRLVVLVTRNGEPVSGLTADDFAFTTAFVPAGGPAIATCPAGGLGCGSSVFQHAAGGSYALFLHPGPVETNWKAGNYYGEVTVSDSDGNSGVALVEIVIP